VAACSNSRCSIKYFEKKVTFEPVLTWFELLTIF